MYLEMKKRVLEFCNDETCKPFDLWINRNDFNLLLDEATKIQINHEGNLELSLENGESLEVSLQYYLLMPLAEIGIEKTPVKVLQFGDVYTSNKSIISAKYCKLL